MKALLCGAFLLFSFPAVPQGQRSAAAEEKLAAVHQAGIRLYKTGCRKPTRVTRKAVTNIHDASVTDSIRTAFCPGLEISTYRANATQPPTDIPAAVLLTDPKRALPFDLRVGASRRDVERLIGAPDRTEGDTAHYRVTLEGPGDDVVLFEYVGDRVGRVHWAFHIE